MAKKRNKSRAENLPASATLQEPYRPRDYHEALGIFIHDFAFAESILFFLLVRRSGVTMRVGRAVFSGVRVDAAIDYIRRIEQANTGSRELAPDLTEALERFKAISTVRNDILHYGGYEGDAQVRIISNQLKALTAEQQRITTVSTDTLDEMASDCVKCAFSMVAEISKTTTAFLAQFGGELPDFAIQALQRPWRYTPPQPKRPRNSDPAGPQSPEPPKPRARQRRASRA